MKVGKPLPQRSTPVACKAPSLWSYSHRRAAKFVRSRFFALLNVAESFDRRGLLIMVMAERLAIRTDGDANLRGGGNDRMQCRVRCVIFEPFQPTIAPWSAFPRSGRFRYLHGADGHLRGESDSVPRC